MIPLPHWCIYKLDKLLNVKKIMPMPDFQIQLFGSFFLLWRCFWLLITIIHRSLSLAWRSIPSPITTFSLLRMRGSEKMAENRPYFWRSVAISSSLSSLYIYLCKHPIQLFGNFRNFHERRRREIKMAISVNCSNKIPKT